MKLALEIGLERARIQAAGAFPSPNFEGHMIETAIAAAFAGMEFLGPVELLGLWRLR
jgi:hypothetical protein